MYVRAFVGCVVLTCVMSRLNVKKLISLVHAKPALWDQKHDDYNNKIYVKQVWEEIGEKMSCTVEGCKLKWRSLRDMYRRELKKYQYRLNDPTMLDKSLPKWFCFKELQFLTEHLSGLENLTESPQEVSEEYFDSLYVKNEPELLDEEEITLEADDDLLLTLTDSKKQIEDKNVKYYTDSDENQFDRTKLLKYSRSGRGRKRTRPTERNDRNDDSDYHFLMSLLPFLQAIPKRRKMLVRTKIQNVFCEEVEPEDTGS